ncbi:MAG TPA: hypothetical protein ENH85_06320 [Candidatus Scalindua sp.]|nr:hypothetical protein [Candidatus Scalindua sp.]
MNQFLFSTKNDFFKTKELVVKIDDESIVFRKPTIDWVGPTHKTTKYNKSYEEWRNLVLYDDRLITGKFEIDDEDSDEDQVVIYYREE